MPVELLINGIIDDQSFRELLKRVEITIVANATSAAPPPRTQQAAGDAFASDRLLKVTLDSVALEGDQVTQIVSGPGDSPRHYAIFKADLYVRYPTAKLHRPVIHFTATATLNPPTPLSLSPILDSDYLPSALPEPENLLGNLVQSIKPVNPNGDALSLPASRLVKVAPRASSNSEDARPLRTSSKLIPVFPILLVRVTSTEAMRMPEPVASLDLELARYVECSVNIHDITVKANRLRSECLTESLQSSLILQSGDRSSLMYKLHDDAERGSASQVDHVLEVDITAVVQLSDSCKPRLKAQWRGGIPFFGKGPSHWRRPTSSSSDVFTSRPVSKHLSMVGRPTSMLGQDLGVTFSFSGPSIVNNGETFCLDIFIVNRSSRRKRLAIIAVPNSMRTLQTSASGLRPLSATSEVLRWHNETAESVIESKYLFKQQSNRQHHTAEVVCLNADVRIGYVQPPDALSPD